MEDAIAVLEAAGSNEAAVIGLNDGTLIAMLLAVAYPERCGSLVLFAPPRTHQPDAGLPMEAIDAVLETRSGPTRRKDEAVSSSSPRVVPKMSASRRTGAGSNALREAWGDGHYYRQTMQADIRDVLPTIRVPTLVLNRSGNPIVAMDLSREVASLIPEPGSSKLPGEDHLAYSQDMDDSWTRSRSS